MTATICPPCWAAPWNPDPTSRWREHVADRVCLQRWTDRGESNVCICGCTGLLRKLSEPVIA